MQAVDRLITQFQPDYYNLTLLLSEVDKTFEGTVKIHGTIDDEADAVRLHAKDLKIAKALINGDVANISIDKEADEVIVEAKNYLKTNVVIELQFNGQITDAMHGLYPCYFKHNGEKKQLLATQFESHHAREVFPCIDEPEAKATFDLTLYTKKNVEVLGNMPIVAQEEDDNWLITSFERSPRMSSYLLAFVVGELQCKQAMTINGTEVRVWATLAQPVNTLDFALQSAVRTIEFFNDYFGIDYPLPKSDHVALPDFASGAMENWGLITYREVTLLVDPATTSVSVKEYVATVVAHELSHQWFGNLVTMKWWDDLWLNESFATLMEYIAIDSLYPEWNIWLTFASNEGLAALRRDALPGVQPVKAEVNHPDEIGTLFDGAIVYAKGSRLLNMLYHYIGEEAFRKGLRTYFETHKYSNTIGMDLWHALGSASNKDIAHFMDKWILQPGFPLISVNQTSTELSIEQRRFSLTEHTDPSHVNWPVPLLTTSQTNMPELLEADHASYPLTSTDLVRVNSGGIGHYSVRYVSSEQRSQLKKLVQDNSIEPAERLLLLNDGAMQARAGIGSMSEVLKLLSAYSQEQSEPVWDMISLIIADTRRLIEDEEKTEMTFKRFIRRLIEKEYNRLGWDEKVGEPNSDTKLRATILGLGVYCEDKSIIDEALRMYDESSDIATLPSEIRGVILSAAVRHGEDKIFDDLLQFHNVIQNAELKQEIAGSLTSTRNELRIKQLLSLLTDQTVVRLQDVDHWFIWLIRNRYGRELAWGWMVDNWSWIEKNFSNDKSYENYPRYAASALSTHDLLERYTTFFTPLAKLPALRRTITMGMADILSRADWRKRDAPYITEFLAK